MAQTLEIELWGPKCRLLKTRFYVRCGMRSGVGVVYALLDIQGVEFVSLSGCTMQLLFSDGVPFNDIPEKSTVGTRRSAERK